MKLTLPVMLAVAAIGLFSSCAKITDFRKHHPGADEHFCKIEKFYLRGYDNNTGVTGPSVEYDISYNAKGNPIELRPRDYTQMVGYISRYKYDFKDRLINYRLDAINSPTDSLIIFEHRYYYSSDGKMLVDSDYELPGDFKYTPPFTRCLLDAQGRIIKTYQFQLSYQPEAVDIVDYNYDAGGNLGSTVDEFFPTLNVVYRAYDGMVNWRQTSKTWQLIDRNYSRSNAIDPDPGGPFHINGYNSFGLPLQFVNYELGAQILSAAYQYAILNFQYDCDVSPGPRK